MCSAFYNMFHKNCTCHRARRRAGAYVACANLYVCGILSADGGAKGAHTFWLYHPEKISSFLCGVWRQATILQLKGMCVGRGYYTHINQPTIKLKMPPHLRRKDLKLVDKKKNKKKREEVEKCTSAEKFHYLATQYCDCTCIRCCHQTKHTHYFDI